MKMEEIINRQESSIEIGRNSKGQITFSVKVYDTDAGKSSNKAIELTDGLIKKYPFV